MESDTVFIKFWEIAMLIPSDIPSSHTQIVETLEQCGLEYIKIVNVQDLQCRIKNPKTFLFKTLKHNIQYTFV